MSARLAFYLYFRLLDLEAAEKLHHREKGVCVAAPSFHKGIVDSGIGHLHFLSEFLDADGTAFFFAIFLKCPV